MKKNASEIYNKLVAAEVGELVPTKHKSGIEYSCTIEDALKQQGYKRGVDYESVFDWRSCRTFIKKLEPIGEYKQPAHDFKVGDIVYNSWGWEQTNIDYYQVVSTAAKTISLRKIKSHSADYDARMMTGSSKAIKDAFADDKILRKTPYYFSDAWRINFEFGAGAKWDGEPMHFSCYA